MSRIDLILLVEPWVLDNLYLDIERLNLYNFENEIESIYKKYGKSVKSDMGKTLMLQLVDCVKRQNEIMLNAGLNATFQHLVAKQMNIFQIFDLDLYKITRKVDELEPLNHIFEFDKLITERIPPKILNDRYGVVGFVDLERIKTIAMAVKPFKTLADFKRYFKKNGINDPETEEVIERFKDKDTASDWKLMCETFHAAVKKKWLIGLVADKELEKYHEGEG